MATTKTMDREATQETPAAKPQRKRITRRQAVEQRVREYFDAIDRRDLAALAEHWDEDGVLDVVAAGVMRGRGAASDFLASLFAAMPDLRTTVLRVVPGERSCVVEWRMEGTFRGAPFMGVDPTGRGVDLRGVDLIELEDGLIASVTAYFDGAAFARQIGMLPPDGSGADRAMKGAFNTVTRLRRAVSERRGG